jgi:hypothetical protein
MSIRIAWTIFTAAEGGPVRHRNFTRRHYKPAVEKAEGVPDELRFTICATLAPLS